ncbi:hypothetical protein BME24068_05796 [Burkholderia metallica]|nr:hypothetical protein BME24068_05796 [Burkholderia metallica]
MPRGAKASPPCGRPVCRRCGTRRGRIAHATLFSGTRPRCRTRQEWKYTGTRDGRSTRRSASAPFGAPERRPYGRVAHYRDTFAEVMPFALHTVEIGAILRVGIALTVAIVDAPCGGIYRLDGERDRGVSRFQCFGNRANVTRMAMNLHWGRAPSIASVTLCDSLRPHRFRCARKRRKVRSMAKSMSSAADVWPFRCARSPPSTSRLPVQRTNR